MIIDIDKERIEKQAREILDKFAHALEGVEKEHEPEGFVDREEFERKEKTSSKNLSCGINNGFKEKMLSNAPLHDNDFIIAETKEWK